MKTLKVNGFKPVSDQLPEIIVGESEQGREYLNITHLLQHAQGLNWNDFLDFQRHEETLDFIKHKAGSIPEEDILVYSKEDNSLLVEMTIGKLFLLNHYEKYRHHYLDGLLDCLFEKLECMINCPVIKMIGSSIMSKGINIGIVEVRRKNGKS